MKNVNLTPTTDLYGQLQCVINYFNSSLFDDALPDILITLQRGKNTAGYVSVSRWRHIGGMQVSELALNPLFFASQPLITFCQTVVHELCHLWQHVAGTASRPGYHNAEWAKKMMSIGLMPSSTGEPGGAHIGQKMSDYPIPGGKFLEACENLIIKGFVLTWIDQEHQTNFNYRSITRASLVMGQHVSEQLFIPLSEFFPNLEHTTSHIKKSMKVKAKYNCPSCHSKVWGKRGLVIMCISCNQVFQEDS